MIELSYESGTLLAGGGRPPKPFVWDARTEQWRAPAGAYRETVLALRESGTPYKDHASSFEKLSLESRVAMEPRPYQREALAAWRREELRGTVVLPTGAGKTAVAVRAIERTGRSTLVVVPTLALLKQWYSVLSDSFGASITVGLLGGGYHEITPLSVTTYDSAYIHAERYGDRFALVVYDEVHHLPAEKYAVIPQMLLAPYSLGLTATPERPDGGHELLPGSSAPWCTAGRRRTWPAPTWRLRDGLHPRRAHRRRAGRVRGGRRGVPGLFEEASPLGALSRGLAAVHHGGVDEPFGG
jgi:hypothetical protein